MVRSANNLPNLKTRRTCNYNNSKSPIRTHLKVAEYVCFVLYQFTQIELMPSKSKQNKEMFIYRVVCKATEYSAGVIVQGESLVYWYF